MYEKILKHQLKYVYHGLLVDYGGSIIFQEKNQTYYGNCEKEDNENIA